MGADSYRSWSEKTETQLTCRLCGWIGPWIPGHHDSGPVISAFYAHFHASCLIQAAAGYYDDGEADGPRSKAALSMLETLSKPCPECEHRNGWCEHRQPPLPHANLLYSWAQPVPDWVT